MKLLFLLLTTLIIQQTNGQTMETKITSKTIVFIHGLFQNTNGWAEWQKYFEAQGYKCYAPAYPFHEDNADNLRKNINPELRKLTFAQVIDSLSLFIDKLQEKPILIGHSMGGLAVQKLIELNKGVAAVCIDSAPPKGILSFKWSFLKSNLPTINPLKGNSVCLPTVKWFHYAFCNTMTVEQTQIEFDKFVVPENRNIPRSSTRNDAKLISTNHTAHYFLLQARKTTSFLPH